MTTSRPIRTRDSGVTNNMSFHELKTNFYYRTITNTIIIAPLSPSSVMSLGINTLISKYIYMRLEMSELCGYIIYLIYSYITYLALSDYA